jgi:hypothetical protein
MEEEREAKRLRVEEAALATTTAADASLAAACTPPVQQGLIADSGLSGLSGAARAVLLRYRELMVQAKQEETKARAESKKGGQRAKLPRGEYEAWRKVRPAPSCSKPDLPCSLRRRACHARRRPDPSEVWVTPPGKVVGNKLRGACDSRRIT